eukprot:365494-Chlamydomonas_euryale.AAC.12
MSSLLTAWAPASLLLLPPRDVLACFSGQRYRAERTLFTHAFSALKARSIIIDVAAKASAILRSAVAAAETVHEGNAYMIFRAICIGGPRRQRAQASLVTPYRRAQGTRHNILCICRPLGAVYVLFKSRIKITLLCFRISEFN